jgi:hypothetical protein
MAEYVHSGRSRLLLRLIAVALFAGAVKFGWNFWYPPSSGDDAVTWAAGWALTLILAFVGFMALGASRERYDE